MPSDVIRTPPVLSHAGVQPTIPVEVIDENQQVRQMHIADERPLTIYLDSYEIVTLMTLGTQPELLALGYLKNQGLISDISEIKSVQVDWEVNAAAVTSYSQRDDWTEKLGPRIVTTGCGQGTVYGDILDKLDELQLSPLPLKQSAIYELLGNLNSFNDVYRNAGAVHGCALCDGTSVKIL